MPGGLFLVFLDWHGFKVFRLEDLSAVQAFHVVDAVSPGDYLCAVVVTSGLHSQRFDEKYFIRTHGLVKPLQELIPPNESI
jgi:hypothetical protein